MRRCSGQCRQASERASKRPSSSLAQHAHTAQVTARRRREAAGAQQGNARVSTAWSTRTALPHMHFDDTRDARARRADRALSLMSRSWSTRPELWCTARHNRRTGCAEV